MVHLLLIGIILYIAFYILAKLRVSTRITKTMPIINSILLILLIIVVLIKSGLIRVLAMFVGTVIALITEFLGSYF
ncbi:hypothetical protein [Ureibacillus manganicus]|uniref:Uncharacterized protein n=1 Tax=Ureibacillus manganicus DSM 26584 TaxID=1384049 RepID=A0A0A3IVQ9_9BACL|nr:hypothetical protein [Ureibacillus manganicus]KGR78907.1 hypothetical protein CD29_09555 [Ureibacillus manganicus DSM 26584]